jgi:hypothetical protein
MASQKARRRRCSRIKYGPEIDTLLDELAGLAEEIKPNAHWAHLVCKASRAIHMQIIIYHPSDEAIAAVVALLKKLRLLVEAVPDAEAYEANIRWRISRLEEFRKGVLPSVPQKATLETKTIIQCMRDCHEIAQRVWATS